MVQPSLNQRRALDTDHGVSGHIVHNVTRPPASANTRCGKAKRRTGSKSNRSMRRSRAALARVHVHTLAPAPRRSRDQPFTKGSIQPFVRQCAIPTSLPKSSRPIPTTSRQQHFHRAISHGANIADYITRRQGCPEYQQLMCSLTYDKQYQSKLSQLSTTVARRGQNPFSRAVHNTANKKGVDITDVRCFLHSCGYKFMAPVSAIDYSAPDAIHGPPPRDGRVNVISGTTIVTTDQDAAAEAAIPMCTDDELRTHGCLPLLREIRTLLTVKGAPAIRLYDLGVASPFVPNYILTADQRKIDARFAIIIRNKIRGTEVEHVGMLHETSSAILLIRDLIEESLPPAKVTILLSRYAGILSRPVPIQSTARSTQKHRTWLLAQIRSATELKTFATSTGHAGAATFNVPTDAMLIQTLGTTDFTTTPSSRPHLPWVPPAMLRDAMKCTTLKAFFTLIIDQESDDAIKSSYDAAAATAAARSVFATSTGLSGHPTSPCSLPQHQRRDGAPPVHTNAQCTVQSGRTTTSSKRPHNDKRDHHDSSKRHTSHQPAGPDRSSDKNWCTHHGRYVNHSSADCRLNANTAPKKQRHLAVNATASASIDTSMSDRISALEASAKESAAVIGLNSLNRHSESGISDRYVNCHTSTVGADEQGPDESYSRLQGDGGQADADSQYDAVAAAVTADAIETDAAIQAAASDDASTTPPQQYGHCHCPFTPACHEEPAATASAAPQYCQGCQRIDSVPGARCQFGSQHHAPLPVTSPCRPNRRPEGPLDPPSFFSEDGYEPSRYISLSFRPHGKRPLPSLRLITCVLEDAGIRVASVLNYQNNATASTTTITVNVQGSHRPLHQLHQHFYTTAILNDGSGDNVLDDDAMRCPRDDIFRCTRRTRANAGARADQLKYESVCAALDAWVPASPPTSDDEDDDDTDDNAGSPAHPPASNDEDKCDNSRLLPADMVMPGDIFPYDGTEDYGFTNSDTDDDAVTNTRAASPQQAQRL